MIDTPCFVRDKTHGHLSGPVTLEEADRLMDDGHVSGIFPVGPTQMYEKAVWGTCADGKPGWYLVPNVDIFGPAS